MEHRDDVTLAPATNRTVSHGFMDEIMGELDANGKDEGEIQTEPGC